MRFREKPAYTFDDVLLVPQHSKIASRADVDLSTTLGGMKLKLPILSANMDTVTEAKMAIAMSKAGGAGILHRFADNSTQQAWLNDMLNADAKPKIISIGLNVSIACLESMCREWNVDAICVDVAHGDHDRVLELIKSVRGVMLDIDIIAGNVATGAAAVRLVRAGANIIKVGIGPGSVCSTRIMTGHGVPQLSAILDVSMSLNLQSITPNFSIIADGGIRNAGDIVKALAAGADAVMLGSLLAGTEESPGDIIMQDGQAFKAYRGMASFDVQKEKRSGGPPRVEGVSAKVPFRGSVHLTLASLESGVRSGLSYSGARNLDELRESAEFVVVTQNGMRESGTHHPSRLSST
jgi:IMP dehydrogenase